MKVFTKTAVCLIAAFALAVPTSAIAEKPKDGNGLPSHAKGWGKRCKGQSKKKDPLTGISPFKACVKAKGEGYVRDENGNLVPAPVTPPVVDGTDDGTDDGS